jgi:hypothetical protein
LDEDTKKYELGKLSRSLLRSIDETSSITAKQKLRALEKEIVEAQKEENELTQHDLDIL